MREEQNLCSPCHPERNEVESRDLKKMNYLTTGLEQLKIPLSESGGSKLEKYISLLQEYNQKFDLINADEHDEIAVQHILDSLSAFPILAEKLNARAALPNATEICDMGSGAGLPGIPLAIVLAETHPNVKITLVERMEKRCGFLKVCIETLCLKNVTVLNSQGEELVVGKNTSRFDFIVFRAFRPLDKRILKMLLSLTKKNGELLAYKARKEKIKTEMEALGKAAPNYEIRPLVVPFLTENSIAKDGENRERNLVVVLKTN